MPKVTAEYIEQKKKLIVESATEVCDKKAVCSVTMQDVIDKSGLSQGGIYRFYQNIDDILIDVLHLASSFNPFNIEEKIILFKNNLEEAKKEKSESISKIKRQQIIKEFIVQVCDELAILLENNLHPFFSIHFGFSDMVLNYPERAKYIFSKAKNPFSLEKEILLFINELENQIKDNVIVPKILPQEFIDFFRTCFLGITQTALVDERYTKDILGEKNYSQKISGQFKVVQKSAIYFLGLENIGEK